MRRLLIPCDLRSADDRSTPAANIMSYAFLNRRGRDCEDAAVLLRGIQSEMDYIRREKASLYFIRTLEVLCWIPAGMRLGARTHDCFATCLLSNLGDPTRLFAARFPRERGQLRVGDLILEHISAYPPLRPQTHAGVIVGMYTNELSICFRFDAGHFSKDDGECFADGYVRRLEESAQGVC